MPDRAKLIEQLAADLRAISVGSGQMGHHFARLHRLPRTDLHALLHMMVAETVGEPLHSRQLGERMGLSNAAVTYLVDRVVNTGHVRRETDDADRRKVVLRLENSAMNLGREFFAPLGAHMHAAMADLPDDDLRAAHEVAVAMNAAMSTFEKELRG
jgi:DNA-binding MarR family transcriptional regulator